MTTGKSTDVEIFLPIPGWEGHYEVSSKGRVKALRRKLPHKHSGSKTYPERILKTSSNARDGHPFVYLSGVVQGEPVKCYVHELVLITFVGPRPEGYVSRHLDDDPRNNVVGNLTWGTRSENGLDRSRNGRDKNRNKTHCIRGHAFDELNTLYTKEGYRKCRTCAKIRMREFHERRHREMA